ncbi:hypothetical protein CP532_4372 [Ophiocordyceps camponoti-leonardi (nom. inval.)]|nr:hypothetical protein CP532_4372 [Ophiocordyceps camponoti-leonardi (nom. inval.)]
MAYLLLLLLLARTVYSVPAKTMQSAPAKTGIIESRALLQDWQETLSEDTRRRYGVARGHLLDRSDAGQAFRHDTIMRINIEREALDLPLIDLSQAFGIKLPTSRASVTAKKDTCLRKRSDDDAVHVRSTAEEAREAAYLRSDTMTHQKAKRSTAEEAREAAYLRSDTMTHQKAKRSIAEEAREAAYLRSDTMTHQKAKRGIAEEAREAAYLRSDTMTHQKMKNKRSTAEEAREAAYLRSDTMTHQKSKRGIAEEAREAAYLRSDTMTHQKNKRETAEEAREAAYLRSGTMTHQKMKNKRSNPPKSSNETNADAYGSLLDRQNLALGAIERINISRRIRGQPEMTEAQAADKASHADEYVSGYWRSSMDHGRFWTADQVEGRPNFVEGGQGNGFGFTQSTFHKLHCLASLRMLLSWHIGGEGGRMTRDIEVHAIHCLEYIRWRELSYPDLNEEPIDTVDYKGMGIH